MTKKNNKLKHQENKEKHFKWYTRKYRLHIELHQFT